MNVKKVLVIFILGMFVASVVNAAQCSYDTWRWNVKQARAVDYRHVQHDYASLQPYEIDKATGCSVCIEDQVRVHVPPIKPFLVCKVLAPKVEATLRELIANGAKIKTVVAYRVGQTKGKLDNRGNRTQFSNHSFGTAIDINQEHNGLYKNCFKFGPQCKLSRGGPWRPRADAYSLEPKGLIVIAFKRIGLKWGGEIQGRQKDFMHFSITGY